MNLEKVLGLAVAVMLAGSAKADIIDFSTSGVLTGTVTYAGGQTALVGSNIGIGGVSGFQTPSNAGVTAAITNGVLSFTTGTTASFNAATQTYTWTGPGTIQITGTGPGCLTVGGCPGNTPNALSGQILLSGVITFARYEVGGTLKLATLGGTDQKDPLLVQFFGFNPNNTTFQFGGAVFTSPPVSTANGGFSANAGVSTDITNTATVPDGSSTLLLLSLAMMGGGLIARRIA